jgi:transcription elongation GreA/GreB family factor
MNHSVTAAATIAALLMTSAASAATVTNRDANEVKIILIEGDVRQEKLLSPGKVLDGVCQKGCIVRFNDSGNDEYELSGSDAVSVEEGFLYYDNPVGDGAPQDGSAGTPVKKKSQ